MERKKRDRLEKAGWRIGSVRELLGLSEEEEALVEMRLALTRKLSAVRQQRGLTQVQVASLLGSSQSRVAKMEAGDPSVSLDLMLRSLVRLGVSRKEIGKALG
jgi:predicted XRE-type DNA-binding protein